MKTPVYLAVLLVSILLFTACTKTETAYYPETSKILVIVTDNDPSSDIMVGILGAVKSSNPGMQVQIFQSKAFDVYQGSYLLSATMMSYPAGTYFAGIVEPGASSKRIVFEAGNKFIMAPDNMLSTRILYNFPTSQCYFIENPVVLGGALPKDISFEEFYKRAILSLISGTPLSNFGSACTNPLKFQIQEPAISGDTVKGEILFADNFGNCITNIPGSLVSDIGIGSVLDLISDTTQMEITMGVTYSSVPVGNNVCFINSSQRLELSVNYGNFAGKYQLGASSKIYLRKQ
jgi:S-adenosylmethionine hydrolase